MSKTFWQLVTVSRTWPWENRAVLEDVLGRRVAQARDDGFTRFVLVHGAYGLDPLGHYKHDPPRSDSIARAIWVGEWGFPDEPHFANFGQYGRAAGPIRNSEMVQSLVLRLVERPDDRVACDAFIVASSAGATGTAELAERAGILTKRHHLEKAEGPAVKKRRGPKMAVIPGSGRVVPVKSRRRIDPARHVVPNNVPGPCGRCGRVSYLATDNLLYHGDGLCVYWDDKRRAWLPGCGVDRPLVSPAVVAGASVGASAAATSGGQAASGRGALRVARAS